MPSPHFAAQLPQSAAHVEQVSLPPQLPSPQ
jgi:hypothetical protein